MLIVSAPDTTHQEIEILLLNISRMNPKNMEQSSPGLFSANHFHPTGLGTTTLPGGMF
jgi:hypothetical protein